MGTGTSNIKRLKGSMNKKDDVLDCIKVITVTVSSPRGGTNKYWERYVRENGEPDTVQIRNEENTIYLFTPDQFTQSYVHTHYDEKILGIKFSTWLCDDVEIGKILKPPPSTLQDELFTLSRGGCDSYLYEDTVII